MASDIKLSGVRATIRGIDLGFKRTDQALKRAILEEARAIMRDAKDNYVPIGGGDLAASGTVSSNKGVVTLSFGAHGASAYALAVHEHPSRHSPFTWKGKKVNFSRGGPKYLEKPIRKAKREFATRVAKRAASYKWRA